MKSGTANGATGPTTPARTLGQRVMQVHFHSVFAIFTLSLMAVLLWFGKISDEIFAGVTGLIVGWYFGKGSK